MLDDVWLVNPLTVVNFRYGLQRFPGSHYLLSQGFDLTTLGLPKSLVDQLGFRHPMGVVFPRVEVAGSMARAAPSWCPMSAAASAKLGPAGSRQTA